MKKILMTLILLITLSSSTLAQKPSYESNTLLIKLKSTAQENSSKLSSVESEIAIEDMLFQWHPNTVEILDFPSHTPQLLNSVSLQSTPADGALIKVTLDPDKDLDSIITTLQNHPQVDYVEPNYYVYAFEDISNGTPFETPNDPQFSQQHYLNTTPLKYVLNLPINSDVVVAVLDTGIDSKHEDIKDNLFINKNETLNEEDDDNNGKIDDISGYSFLGYNRTGGNNNTQDFHGHGSHISGIISAKNNNNLGISSLNPNAKILNAKFLNSYGWGTQDEAAAAIYYAADMGAKVINCSWGYKSYSHTLRNAIDYATEKGAIVLAASGNDNKNTLEYPAALDNTIAVASVSTDHNRSFFSNYGGHIDFATYGENILSLAPNNQYTQKSGTSQSTAIMSGVISRIIAAVPDISTQEIMQILIDSSEKKVQSGKDIYMGYGIINGENLETAINTRLNSPSKNTKPSTPAPKEKQQKVVQNLINFPNPAVNQTTFQFESTQTGPATLQIYTLSGRLIKEIDQEMSIGSNKVSWNLKDDTNQDLNNGSYIYAIKADNLEKSPKGILSILR